MNCWFASEGCDPCEQEPLPGDIRECLEVLRDAGIYKGYDWFPDDSRLEDTFQAATWQILEYLGVL